MKKAYLLSQPSPFAIISQPSTKTPTPSKLRKQTNKTRPCVIYYYQIVDKKQKQKKEKEKNNQPFIIYYIVQESYVFESAGKFSEYKRLHSLFIHFYTR